MIVGENKSAVIKEDGIPYKEFKLRVLMLCNIEYLAVSREPRIMAGSKNTFLKEGLIVRVMDRDELTNILCQKRNGYSDCK